jgi:glycerophosphoryl diester phosphodiesterase
MFSFTALTDKETPYPRYCCHRGFSTVAPENTLPAFAAAISLGAQEIELDLWPTSDGEIVVCHDPTVDRTTNGSGKIVEMTYADITKLDAGFKFSERWSGLQIPRFEDVLRLFSRQVIINIHIKSISSRTRDPIFGQRTREFFAKYRKNESVTITDERQNPPFDVVPDGNETGPSLEYDPSILWKIISIIDHYDCRQYIYFTGEKDVLTTALKVAPDIARCCLEGHMDYSIVEAAIKYQCKKVQFTKMFLTRAMIKKARASNMICNIFWSDNLAEARSFLDLGIDTLLTNDFLAVRRAF